MQLMRMIISVGLSAALLVLSVSVVAEDSESVVEAEILTVGGNLQVLRETVDDGTYGTFGPNVDLHYSVVLNGKTVVAPEEVLGYKEQSRSIVESYPKEGLARLVLFEIGGGGSGCPMSYAVMEIQENGQTRTAHVGNCLSIARPPVFKEGQWVLHFYAPSGGLMTDTWVYRNGKAKRSPSSRITLSPTEVTEDIVTRLGRLQLRDHFDPKDWQYLHSDAVLNGKTLLRASSSYHLTVAARYPETGPAALLLLRDPDSLRTPMGPYYYVIDLSLGNEPKLAKPFFTYGEGHGRQHHVQTNFTNKKWVIEFRDRPDSPVREAWVYAESVVHKETQ